ncbi:MAG: YfhO family protein [Thermoanaerobaculia bacterium]
MGLNPALPLLVALSLAGLLFRRRETARAWVVVGLAGVALLWPALVLPDGLPSPSGTLSGLAPWQGQLPEARGNPDLLDVTFKVEPWLMLARSELRHGRLPFWNPYQFAGAPLWANGQVGVLHPLHWLFDLLPLPLAWVVLPWARVMLAGLGAFRLARELRIGPNGALVAALSFALCGRVVSFLLFPMASALAMAPWVMLGVERLALGQKGVRFVALAGALQLLGGHPETGVYTALGSALYLAARRPRPWLGSLARLVAGWALAALLAGLELVPVAVHLAAGSRWQAAGAAGSLSLGETLPLLARFVLPEAYGNRLDGSYFGTLPFIPSTVYAGLLVLCLSAAGLSLARRDRRVQGLVAVVGIGLAATLAVPGFPQLFAHLPVLDKGLPHYLLVMVELALALAAGLGLELWRAGRGRAVARGAAFAAGGWLLCWLLLHSAWQRHGLTAPQAGWTLAGLALLVALALSLRAKAQLRERLTPWLLLAAAVDLVVAHAGLNPGLSARALHPATPALDFLAGKPGRIAAVGHTLRPNAATAYGLFDLRGDDSTKSAAFERLYGGELATPDPADFQPLTRWEGSRLDALGVRWVLASPHAAPPWPGAAAAYSGADATVFERPGALPIVRFAEPQPEQQLTVLEQHPGSWEIDFALPAPARLVVAESWSSGWYARLDGRAVAIEKVNPWLLGVDLPAGRGRLRLSYLPEGIGWGLAASLAGLGLWLSFSRLLEPGIRSGEASSREMDPPAEPG